MPPTTTSATSTTTLTGNRNASLRRRQSTNPHPAAEAGGGRETKRNRKQGILETAAFLRWGLADVAGAVKLHPVPCVFAASLLFFMAVEYTLLMVPASAPPFDVGFIATRWLNDLLASSPALNTLLAALNTVFVAMQSTYILWTFLIEGRIRPGLAALYMFTCRGILGYSTQLPLPQDFLGSGADFPVGNVSFFLFYSGHVAGSVIASLDMRRVQRKEMARAFDLLNFLQAMRLLGTRGHYTIDLAVGVGAGILFDFLAGIYDDQNKKNHNRDGSLSKNSRTQYKQPGFSRGRRIGDGAPVKPTQSNKQTKRENTDMIAKEARKSTDTDEPSKPPRQISEKVLKQWLEETNRSFEAAEKKKHFWAWGV